MELELLKSLVLITEAKALHVEAPEPEAEQAPPEDTDTSFSPEKTAFFFKPKFDIYGNLQQTEDQALRRETKRIYSMFDREHERSTVYSIDSSHEREFKRVARVLGISTDGEVTLERVKRAGFTSAGRIENRRLMKRGDFVVSLVGPSDDKATIRFYTAKPVETVKESVTLSEALYKLRDRIVNVDALGTQAENPEQHKLLKKVLTLFGAKTLSELSLWGYDTDSFPLEFKKIMRTLGLKGSEVEAPTAQGLRNAGFEIAGRTTVDVIYKHNDHPDTLIAISKADGDSPTKVFVMRDHWHRPDVTK